MKSFSLYVLLLLAVGEEYRSFVAKGSSPSPDDLSRALGALQRRRRWLEAGLSPDLDNLRRPYGTVTHYPTNSMRKKSYMNGNLYDMFKAQDEALALYEAERAKAEQDEEDANNKNKMMMKKSAFREREHILEEEKKRRRKKRLLVLKKRQEEDDGGDDRDGRWGDTEEQLKTMARERFLDAMLSQNGPGREGDFLSELREEDISALVDLLRKDLAERYMEGEGPGEEDDARKKKRLGVKKRMVWQDGFRQALGDNWDKRGGEMVGDGWPSATSPSSAEEVDSLREKWWSLDPQMLTEISKIEDGHYGRFDDSDENNEMEESDENPDNRKREIDPWYPAYDIRKRNRNHLWSAYAPSSSASLFKRLVPLKRKRTPGSSAFRERDTHDPGMTAYVGTSKRSAPIKRSPEEPVAIRKRTIAKKSTEPHVLNELKTILADEKDEKRVSKREDTSVEEEDLIDGAATPSPALAEDEDELSKEQLSELMLDEDGNKKKRKRKRSWDDYLGIDKRSVKRANASDDNGTASSKKVNEEASSHDLNQWMMNRYFKSMAAAMSSKKKRTIQDEDKGNEEDGSGHHPLLAMDRRLEAIENLMLEEALEMVEGRGAGDGGSDQEDQREKIVHRLDAAHSLEKMRGALADFEHSLDRIHDDEQTNINEEDEDESEEKKKKKKADSDKQNLVEALHVMAPQSTKRTSVDDNDDSMEAQSECPVFTEIAMLCTELSKAAGDSQRSLVGACSRHVMCYACDYAYDEGPRIPCDLIFMREAHEICGDNLYCRSAAAQMHGVLRERAPAIRRSNSGVCLSTACVKAYRRR